MSEPYRPGRFEAQYECLAYTIYEDEYDVAQVACYPKEREDGVAEFIVRACNSHEELLTELKRVIERLAMSEDLARTQGHEARAENLRFYIDRASATVARAEKGK